MRNAWRSLLTRRLHIRRTSALLQSRFLSSSTPAVESNAGDNDLGRLVQSLSEPISSQGIKSHLESSQLNLDHNNVNSLLRQLRSAPESASGVFDWVLEKDGQKLSSKSYNVMIQILGCNGKVNEFWDLVERMKKLGYGISRSTYDKVYENFAKNGFENDFKLLKEIDFLNSPRNVAGRTCGRISRILQDGLDDKVRGELQDLNVKLSTDLVVAVLNRVASDPNKALAFMRWVEENRGFRINGRVYNALVRVLGREDCMVEFQGVVDRMRDGGYELEMDTFAKVSEKFYRRKMVGEVVDLYEFAMGGSKKPSLADFVLLLKKIFVTKDFDLSLISRVVTAYTSGGISASAYSPLFDSVIKSLRSVGRLSECDKVLKAMVDGGFVADSVTNYRVVTGLCDTGRADKALHYLHEMEKSGHSAGIQAWTSLVQKHCHLGELDKAFSCIRQMTETTHYEDVSGIFDVLVSGFCQKNRASDAVKILKEMVTQKNLKFWHSTYKLLIDKLISQGNIKDASTLFSLMKSNGYPPFVEPFIRSVSKSGSVDDAITFLKAMTVKEFPSKTIFLRVFEELLKAGLHEAAQDLLSMSPGSVRNHADVLELFYSSKPNESSVGVAI